MAEASTGFRSSDRPSLWPSQPVSPEVRFPRVLAVVARSLLVRLQSAPCVALCRRALLGAVGIAARKYVRPSARPRLVSESILEAGAPVLPTAAG